MDTSRNYAQLQLPAMNATIEQIIDFLKVINGFRQSEENWRTIRQTLGWKDEVFCRVAPTCERLGLITKEPGKRLELRREGELLIEKSEREARDILGKLLLHWSKQYRVIEAFFRVYEELNIPPGSSIDLDELIAQLRKFGVSMPGTYTIFELLNTLFTAIGLVDFEQGKPKLDLRRYEELSRKKIFRFPSDKIFFNALRKAYLEILPEMGGMKYVSIPKVRTQACRRDMLNIPEYLFDEKIKAFPLTFYGYRIIFAPARWRKPGGIQMGRNYYYYLSIIEIRR